MSTLLLIRSSLFSQTGESSKLADRFAADWRARGPRHRIVVRDLAEHPVPHLTAARFQAFVTPTGERTPQQNAEVAQSDELIAELRAADAVALALPMYNFGIPSTLKAWFDHVARAGETFRYTAQGPEGFLRDKPLYVFAARGGHYQGTPRDSQTAHVTDFFNLLGFEQIQWVYAEGLSIDAATRDAALNTARTNIESLAA